MHAHSDDDAQDGAKFDDGVLVQKEKLLADAIAGREAQLAKLDREYHALKQRVCDVTEQNIARLVLELDTGGNIRLEDGKPSDIWHSSCVDLVNSRFNRAQFAPHGIVGINVRRVTRVHNRFLRNRFETRMDAVLAKQAEQAAKSKASAAGEDAEELSAALMRAFCRTWGKFFRERAALWTALPPRGDTYRVSA